MHPHPHQVCFCNCLSCACYLLVFQRPSVSDSHQRFIQPPSNCFLWFSPLHTLKAHLSYHPQSCFIICSSVYRNSSSLPCYTNLTSSPAFPVLLSSSPSSATSLPTTPTANPPRTQAGPFLTPGLYREPLWASRDFSRSTSLSLVCSSYFH